MNEWQFEKYKYTKKNRTYHEETHDGSNNKKWQYTYITVRLISQYKESVPRWAWGHG